MQLSDASYGLGVGLFYVGYILFEVPSNLVLQKIGARKTITRIMCLWGLISMAMAFVSSPLQFYFASILLGAAEAGFFPGVYSLSDVLVPGPHARRASCRSSFLPSRYREWSAARRPGRSCSILAVCST